jgi:hypothetical protein
MELAAKVLSLEASRGLSLGELAIIYCVVLIYIRFW